ncbi:UNVERIFIED_CONTAM: hypothetical protein FKN15_040695 [Acipenser sinensis]
MSHLDHHSNSSVLYGQHRFYDTQKDNFYLRSIPSQPTLLSANHGFPAISRAAPGHPLGSCSRERDSGGGGSGLHKSLKEGGERGVALGSKEKERASKQEAKERQQQHQQQQQQQHHQHHHHQQQQQQQASLEEENNRALERHKASLPPESGHCKEDSLGRGKHLSACLVSSKMLNGESGGNTNKSAMLSCGGGGAQTRHVGGGSSSRCAKNGNSTGNSNSNSGEMRLSGHPQDCLESRQMLHHSYSVPPPLSMSSAAGAGGAGGFPCLQLHTAHPHHHHHHHHPHHPDFYCPPPPPPLTTHSSQDKGGATGRELKVTGPTFVPSVGHLGDKNSGPFQLDNPDCRGGGGGSAKDRTLEKNNGHNNGAPPSSCQRKQQQQPYGKADKASDWLQSHHHHLQQQQQQQQQNQSARSRSLECINSADMDLFRPSLPQGAKVGHSGNHSGKSGPYISTPPFQDCSHSGPAPTTQSSEGLTSKGGQHQGRTNGSGCTLERGGQKVARIRHQQHRPGPEAGGDLGNSGQEMKRKLELASLGLASTFLPMSHLDHHSNSSVLYGQHRFYDTQKDNFYLRSIPSQPTLLSANHGFPAISRAAPGHPLGSCSRERDSGGGGSGLHKSLKEGGERGVALGSKEKERASKQEAKERQQQHQQQQQQQHHQHHHHQQQQQQQASLEEENNRALERHKASLPPESGHCKEDSLGRGKHLSACLVSSKMLNGESGGNTNKSAMLSCGGGGAQTRHVGGGSSSRCAKNGNSTGNSNSNSGEMRLSGHPQDCLESRQMLHHSYSVPPPLSMSSAAGAGGAGLSHAALHQNLPPGFSAAMPSPLQPVLPLPQDPSAQLVVLPSEPPAHPATHHLGTVHCFIISPAAPGYPRFSGSLASTFLPMSHLDHHSNSSVLYGQHRFYDTQKDNFYLRSLPSQPTLLSANHGFPAISRAAPGHPLGSCSRERDSGGGGSGLHKSLKEGGERGVALGSKEKERASKQEAKERQQQHQQQQQQQQQQHHQHHHHQQQQQQQQASLEEESNRALERRKASLPPESGHCKEDSLGRGKHLSACLVSSKMLNGESGGNNNTKSAMLSCGGGGAQTRHVGGGNSSRCAKNGNSTGNSNSGEMRLSGHPQDCLESRQMLHHSYSVPPPLSMSSAAGAGGAGGFPCLQLHTAHPHHPHHHHHHHNHPHHPDFYCPPPPAPLTTTSSQDKGGATGRELKVTGPTFVPSVGHLGDKNSGPFQLGNPDCRGGSGGSAKDRTLEKNNGHNNGVPPSSCQRKQQQQPYGKADKASDWLQSQHHHLQQQQQQQNQSARSRSLECINSADMDLFRPSLPQGAKGGHLGKSGPYISTPPFQDCSHSGPAPTTQSSEGLNSSSKGGQHQGRTNGSGCTLERGGQKVARIRHQQHRPGPEAGGDLGNSGQEMKRKLELASLGYGNSEQQHLPHWAMRGQQIQAEEEQRKNYLDPFSSGSRQQSQQNQQQQQQQQQGMPPYSSSQQETQASQGESSAMKSLLKYSSQQQPLLLAQKSPFGGLGSLKTPSNSNSISCALQDAKQPLPPRKGPPHDSERQDCGGGRSREAGDGPHGEGEVRQPPVGIAVAVARQREPQSHPPDGHPGHSRQGRVLPAMKGVPRSMFSLDAEGEERKRLCEDQLGMPCLDRDRELFIRRDGTALSVAPDPQRKPEDPPMELEDLLTQRTLKSAKPFSYTPAKSVPPPAGCAARLSPCSRTPSLRPHPKSTPCTPCPAPSPATAPCSPALSPAPSHTNKGAEPQDKRGEGQPPQDYPQSLEPDNFYLRSLPSQPTLLSANHGFPAISQSVPGHPLGSCSRERDSGGGGSGLHKSLKEGGERGVLNGESGGNNNTKSAMLSCGGGGAQTRHVGGGNSSRCAKNGNSTGNSNSGEMRLSGHPQDCLESRQMLHHSYSVPPPLSMSSAAGAGGAGGFPCLQLHTAHPHHPHHHHHHHNHPHHPDFYCPPPPAPLTTTSSQDKGGATGRELKVTGPTFVPSVGHLGDKNSGPFQLGNPDCRGGSGGSAKDRTLEKNNGHNNGVPPSSCQRKQQQQPYGKADKASDWLQSQHHHLQQQQQQQNQSARSRSLECINSADMDLFRPSLPQGAKGGHSGKSGPYISTPPFQDCSHSGPAPTTQSSEGLNSSSKGGQHQGRTNGSGCTLERGGQKVARIRHQQHRPGPEAGGDLGNSGQEMKRKLELASLGYGNSEQQHLPHWAMRGQQIQAEEEQRKNYLDPFSSGSRQQSQQNQQQQQQQQQGMPPYSSSQQETQASQGESSAMKSLLKYSSQQQPLLLAQKSPFGGLGSLKTPSNSNSISCALQDAKQPLPPRKGPPHDSERQDCGGGRSREAGDGPHGEGP